MKLNDLEQEVAQPDPSKGGSSITLVKPGGEKLVTVIDDETGLVLQQRVDFSPAFNTNWMMGPKRMGTLPLALPDPDLHLGAVEA